MKVERRKDEFPIWSCDIPPLLPLLFGGGGGFGVVVDW